MGLTRVIWAIDPLNITPADNAAGWAIHALIQKQQAPRERDQAAIPRASSVFSTDPAPDFIIEPVYVMDLAARDLPPEICPEAIEEAAEDARVLHNAFLEKTKLSEALPRLLPLRVLVRHELASPANKAAELLACARATGAELIVAATHARKGLKRWMMGSFTESLILRSEIPVFAINPHCKDVPRLDHINFPTDFSEFSHIALQKTIRLALSLDASLTLFHKVDYEPSPAVEVSFGAYPAYQDIYAKFADSCHQELSQWKDEAREAGVDAEAVLDCRIEGSAHASLLNLMKDRPGIIAMAAHSGRLAATLMGSVSRQVMRSSPQPVWIIHPEVAEVAEGLSMGLTRRIRTRRAQNRTQTRQRKTLAETPAGRKKSNYRKKISSA